MRNNPIYHSTYTGRPPDEPAVLGVALNEVFVPILQKQFPEIADFYLPPEGCSYRMAVVTLKKQYPGHAKRVMMGVWSFLRQFMYTKYVIVCDESVDARNWDSVAKAINENMSPERDCLFIDNTPIDSLDFASPVVGLGSKMGLDATTKWSVERDESDDSPLSCDIEQLENKLRESLPKLKQCFVPDAARGGIVVLDINKSQPGEGQEVLRIAAPLISQYTTAKFIIVCDDDVKVNDWNDIIWAITTRMDPSRDSQFITVENQKVRVLGMDATNKSGAEITREWGVPIKKSPHLVAKVDSIWDELNIL